MLDYSLTLHQPHEGCELELSSNSFGGQKKHRFVLWFIVYDTLVHGFKRITLHLMINGHTKSHDARNPGEMFHRIDYSGNKNRSVAANWVK